jgi:SPOR domain
MSPGASKVIPVSELFNRLAAEYRNAGIPQAQLFQTALRVCGEDSKRTRRGESPAELGELVLQARAILDVSHPRSLHPSLGGRPGEGFGSDRSAPQVPPAPRPEPETGASAAAGAAPPPSPPAPLFPSTPAPAPPEPEIAAPSAAAPFEVHAGPAAPGPETGETPVSFEDVFRQAGQEERIEPEPAPRGGGVSFSVFRIGAVALAVLAAVVVVVILWPGLTRSRTAPPAGPAAVSTDRTPGSERPPEAEAPTPVESAAATAAQPTPEQPPAGTTAPAAPEAAVAVPEPTPAPTHPTPAAAPAPARPETFAGVETMRSPDWSGHAPAFVVHFASYRSRDNATADAARLARDLGRPAYAVLVDLGEKGTWYRVVVGGFATAAEAREFRAGIAAAKTREVGGVYRLAAP